MRYTLFCTHRHFGSVCSEESESHAYIDKCSAAAPYANYPFPNPILLTLKSFILFRQQSNLLWLWLIFLCMCLSFTANVVVVTFFLDSLYFISSFSPRHYCYFYLILFFFSRSYTAERGAIKTIEQWSKFVESHMLGVAIWRTHFLQ